MQTLAKSRAFGRAETWRKQKYFISLSQQKPSNCSIKLPERYCASKRLIQENAIPITLTSIGFNKTRGCMTPADFWIIHGWNKQQCGGHLRNGTLAGACQADFKGVVT